MGVDVTFHFFRVDPVKHPGMISFMEAAEQMLSDTSLFFCALVQICGKRGDWCRDMHLYNDW